MKMSTPFLTLLMIGMCSSAFAEESRDWRLDDGLVDWNETEQEQQSVNAQVNEDMSDVPSVPVDAVLEALRLDYTNQLNTLVEQIHAASTFQDAETLERQASDLKTKAHLAELQFFHEKALAAGQTERAADLYQILQQGLEAPASKIKAHPVARDPRTGLALDPSSEEGGQK